MSLFAAVAVLAAAPLEPQAVSLVRERFEVAGRALPAHDETLANAAEALAKLALEQSASDAAGLLAVTEAVSVAGGWDASPTAVLIKGAPGQLVDELRKQTAIANEAASAFGVGAVIRGERAALCVLLAQRKIELAPLARRYQRAPKSVSVCGVLAAPLETAELFVTSPAGIVTRAPMRRTKGDTTCGTFSPASEGRSVVEVLGRGPKGPEVAALFFIDVGRSAATKDQHVVEPASLADGRNAVLERINALRKSMSLSVVTTDPRLDAIAQAYAQRMAHEGFFAHVDPAGGTLKTRLSDAGYRYVAAGENLGASTGPLAAHFGIEHSPGHRMNLLEPTHSAVGVGLATREADGLAVLVEVLAQPLDDGGSDPLGAAYRVLDELRVKRHLPALTHHPVLEALAQEHARKSLSRDELTSTLPDGKKLHDRVFESMPDAKEAAVDLAIVTSPTLVPASKNVGDVRYTSVGVGLVRGDSARYGTDKLWLVVIYAAAPPSE